jgi:hypothetical protein
VDDYQVRTPTDIIGQHIHLPKWDLTTTDGAANGWNYEDGTLSPGMVQERIEAINHFNATHNPTAPVLTALPHPALGSGENNEWDGGRVTIQRWFADPVYNRDGNDRGLGIIFTHDHYGPSTHQQIGLYSTLLIEPAGSKWVHNETGVELGDNIGRPNSDGGPTSWQAAIEPGVDPNTGDLLAGAVDFEPFREFYLEYSDFQHAYEAGIYVGAGPDGRPFSATQSGHDGSGINVAFPVTANTFRHAINPSYREEAVDGPVGGPFLRPELPDILRYPGICPDMINMRPCPEAISADDPGMLVVNYRNEPAGLRVFDPFNNGPDGKLGTQAASEDINGNGILDPGEDTNLNGVLDTDFRRGDLVHALETRIDRAIPQMNTQPTELTSLQVGVNLYPNNEAPAAHDEPTFFPPPINSLDALDPGDPYTPMMRTRAGDRVTVKVQAGGHEHEHIKTPGYRSNSTSPCPSSPTATRQGTGATTPTAWTPPRTAGGAACGAS